MTDYIVSILIVLLFFYFSIFDSAKTIEKHISLIKRLEAENRRRNIYSVDEDSRWPVPFHSAAVPFVHIPLGKSSYCIPFRAFLRVFSPPSMCYYFFRMVTHRCSFRICSILHISYLQCTPLAAFVRKIMNYIDTATLARHF